MRFLFSSLSESLNVSLLPSCGKTGLLIFAVPVDGCRPVVPLCFCSVLVNSSSYLPLAINWCNFSLWQIATQLWVDSLELLKAPISLLITLMDWIALGISQHPEGIRSMQHSHTLSWSPTSGYGGGTNCQKIVLMTMLRYSAVENMSLC
jgi:hypothetical protein